MDKRVITNSAYRVEVLSDDKLHKLLFIRRYEQVQYGNVQRWGAMRWQITAGYWSGRYGYKRANYKDVPAQVEKKQDIVPLLRKLGCFTRALEELNL